MRRVRSHSTDDVEAVRRLVDDNPWATFISENEGLVASHYPILLDTEADELTVLTHFAKPDDELHGVGVDEMLVIVQGQHGYVSPSWYAPGATRAPTWNFSVAHLYGTPEVLTEEENLETLARLVRRFEQDVAEPMFLDREWARPVAQGTVGLRLRVKRFHCKRKLSQDKDPVSRQNVIDHLRAPGPYRHPALADEVERELPS